MAARPIAQHDPISRYARLRSALELFGELPDALDAKRQQELSRQQHREYQIQQRILASPQAHRVHVPAEVVEQAVQTLSARFDDHDAFRRALEHSGLDTQGLYHAIEHELRVETALEHILASSCQISAVEVEIYYLQHQERFSLPETRTARQILITINEDYVENTREHAHRHLRRIADEISCLDDFARQAERYSECPSAMQQGVLGRVRPGMLFPSLEKALFALPSGQMSAVVESPLGLHLLWCESIHPAENIPFESVREKLHEHLEQRARKRYLKSWLQQK